MHWKLFESLFMAHGRRKAVERCMQLKAAMYSGVWGNSNYDAKEKGGAAPRDAILRQIDNTFDTAIQQIRGGESELKTDIEEDDPFFAAAKVPKIDHDAPDQIADGTKDDYVPEFDQV